MTVPDSSQIGPRLLRVEVTIGANLDITLTDDEDLFFFYKATYNEQAYAELHDSERLSASYEEFPAIFVEILKEVNSSEDFKIELTLGSDSLLTVSQRLKIKTVKLFSLKFQPAADEVVRNHIHSRYRMAQEELERANENMHELLGLLKIKDISVLKQGKTPRK
jgi:hypothetical protein